MSASFEMKGFDTLFQKLQTVRADLRQGIAQNAANAGGRVIRDEARSRIKVKSGRTRAQIRVFTRRTGLKPHEVVAAVGVRDRSKGGREFIARFLEFGVQPHVIEPKTKRGKRKAALILAMGQVVRRVKHPGISPRPWLRPAFDAKSQAALDAMAKALGKGIERAIAKGGGI